MNISNEIIDILNDTIPDEGKKFTLLFRNKKKKCKPKGSFGCWAEKNKKNYILVETTGQNNIQDIRIRVNQQKIILFNFMKKIIMI